MQTISDLWNGSIAPCEHCGERDPQANGLSCVMDRSREELWETATPSQREIFEKYADASEEYLLRMLELAFRDGFCLGVRLAVESLT